MKFLLDVGASIIVARSMGEASIVGMMDPLMKGIGLKTKLKGMERISGWMEGVSKVHGLITIWMGLEFINGRMEDLMKENMSTIKRMDSEYTHGLISDSTMVTGSEENNMVLELIMYLKEN